MKKPPQLAVISVLLLVVLLIPSPVSYFSELGNTQIKTPIQQSVQSGQQTTSVCSPKELSQDISMKVTSNKNNTTVKSILTIYNPSSREIKITSPRELSYQFEESNHVDVKAKKKQIILNITKYSPDLGRGNNTWSLGRRPIIYVNWIDSATGKHCSISLSKNSDVLIKNSDESIFTKSFIFVNEGGIEKNVISTNSTFYNVFYREDYRGLLGNMNMGKLEEKIIYDSSKFPKNCNRENVNIFFVPSDTKIDGQTLKRQNSTSIWIDENEQNNLNILSHELFHAKTCMNPTNKMKWISEGAARYYGVLYTYKTKGTNSLSYPKSPLNDHSEISLTSKNEWEDTEVNYYKGARVVAYLDFQIRMHTENKTFMAVITKLNSNNNAISYPAFRKIVVSLTNEKIGNWMDQHIKHDGDISNRKIEQIKTVIKNLEDRETLKSHESLHRI